MVATGVEEEMIMGRGPTIRGSWRV